MNRPIAVFVATVDDMYVDNTAVDPPVAVAAADNDAATAVSLVESVSTDDLHMESDRPVAATLDETYVVNTFIDHPVSETVFESSSLNSVPTSVEGTTDTDETIIYQNRKRARKGQANRQAWKKFKARDSRMAGQSYEGRQGKSYITKAPRYLGPRCDCRLSKKHSALRCHEFSDDDRQEIFHSFWKELDWEQRKVFVPSMVDVCSIEKPKGERLTSRASLKFSLKKNGERKRVCKQFFFFLP